MCVSRWMSFFLHNWLLLLGVSLLVFDRLVKLCLVELPVFVQVEGIDCLDDVAHTGVLADQLQLGFGQIPVLVLVYQLQKEDGVFYM